MAICKDFLCNHCSRAGLRSSADSIVARDWGGPEDPFCSTHRALKPGGGLCLKGHLFLTHQICGPQPFWHQGLVLRKTIFPQTEWGGGWFQDDSSSLHLLCTLFLLLLHQLHLRSWGTRFQRLRMPAPESVSQFSHSVVSDFLWPHGLQHARPPCPSPTLRVYSNSCPLSR